MRTIIQNAWILTMDESMHEYKNGDIIIADDRIVYVGDHKQNQVYDMDGFDHIVDGRNCIAIPGMVNTHCHASMIPFRSLGDDCPDRLRRFLFPLENACMNEELAYQGARYGIAEMLLAGVTTFADMYYFMDRVAQACVELGMRGVLGETIIDQPTCDANNAKEALKIGESFIQRWQNHSLITPILAPHATNTVSKEIFRKSMDLVRKYDTLLMTHVAEMDYEMTYFQDHYQMTPVEWLNSINCLDEHLLAVHCIHVNAEDIQLMKTHGVRAAHCPLSNLKAGKGVAPVRDMINAEIPVGFGTDGASSGNTLDLFHQMRCFAGAQKTKYHDRSLFPAKDIVYMATMGGAKALRMETEIGSLTAGKKADITLISMEAAHMFPIHDPYSALVYSADASDVKHVFVNGRQVVQQRKTCIDLFALRHDLAENMKDFNRKAAELAQK